VTVDVPDDEVEDLSLAASASWHRWEDCKSNLKSCQ
jgi:hypothetical protein